jgi:hypothetical protein
MFIFNLNVVFTTNFLKVLRRTSRATRSNLLREKPVFPHMVSSDEIPPREILLLEESWAKAHTDWCHFKKVLYEKDLKIKLKPYPENFKLRIYTMKLSAGLSIS